MELVHNGDLKRLFRMHLRMSAYGDLRTPIFLSTEQYEKMDRRKLITAYSTGKHCLFGRRVVVIDDGGQNEVNKS